MENAMDRTFELRNSVGYIAEAIACLQRAESLLEQAAMPLRDPAGVEASAADIHAIREDLLGAIAAPFNEAMADVEQRAYDLAAGFFDPTPAVEVDPPEEH